MDADQEPYVNHHLMACKFLIAHSRTANHCHVWAEWRAKENESRLEFRERQPFSSYERRVWVKKESVLPVLVFDSRFWTERIFNDIKQMRIFGSANHLGLYFSLPRVWFIMCPLSEFLSLPMSSPDDHCLDIFCMTILNQNIGTNITSLRINRLDSLQDV